MNEFDLMEMLKKIKKSRTSSSDTLTIGEMFSKLNNFDDNEKVYFSNGKFFDGSYDSYRGYYQDMYIGCGDADKGENTVGDIKTTLSEALDCGLMVGYKGGEFSIDSTTHVWLSSYGCLGDMVVDIVRLKDKVVVVVEEEEW